MLTRALMTMMLGLPIGASSSAEVPRAVVADPLPDPTAPATMRGVKIPSGDGALLGTFYMASGARAHPTVILMHGLPGFEDNMDLAQAISRDGWNVLVFHYRGTWGSPGSFSIDHAVADSTSALNFVKDPKSVREYRVDPNRIVVAGHSMGGFLAANLAAQTSGVIGTALLDAWDIGATREAMKDPSFRQAFIDQEFVPDMPPLAGTSPEDLAKEVESTGPEFNLSGLIPKIATRPLLIVGIRRHADEVTHLAEIGRRSGGLKVQSQVMDTNHIFSDHRVALAAAIISWLNGLPA